MPAEGTVAAAGDASSGSGQSLPKCPSRQLPAGCSLTLVKHTAGIHCSDAQELGGL